MKTKVVEDLILVTKTAIERSIAEKSAAEKNT